MVSSSHRSPSALLHSSVLFPGGNHGSVFGLLSCDLAWMESSQHLLQKHAEQQL